AGYGWFIDATPADDSEFPATPESPAYGKVDLLTVVVHEIGHALGFEHDSGDGIMAESLPLGVPRMPTPIQDTSTATSTTTDAPPVAVSFLSAPAPTSDPAVLSDSLTTVAVVSPAPADQPAQETGSQTAMQPTDSQAPPVAALDRVFADPDTLF